MYQKTISCIEKALSFLQNKERERRQSLFMEVKQSLYSILQSQKKTINFVEKRQSLFIQYKRKREDNLFLTKEREKTISFSGCKTTSTAEAEAIVKENNIVHG